MKSGIRPLSFETGVNAYAEGSVLVRAGNTHVLCTATVEDGVPPWLMERPADGGKAIAKHGWITAEYSMLPRATHTRTRRDREKVSGRTQEIQRLIGRALRAMVDLKALGPRTITVDCDVLQADGGTRTTSINGGSVALAVALKKLIEAGKVPASVFADRVSAVSVGLKNGAVIVDLNYDQDSTCDVDMNFVVTARDQFVEVQGTAERAAFGLADLDRLTQAALQATAEIRSLYPI
ncbi:MAG: ribonuclease PH [Bdellovibrionota bacterium]